METTTSCISCGNAGEGGDDSVGNTTENKGEEGAGVCAWNIRSCDRVRVGCSRYYCCFSLLIGIVVRENWA